MEIPFSSHQMYKHAFDYYISLLRDTATVWRPVCQMQVWRGGTSNYIPQLIWYVIEDMCARSWYQEQGQVTIFHRISGMWLLVPVLDTCFWYTYPKLLFPVPDTCFWQTISARRWRCYVRQCPFFSINFQSSSFYGLVVRILDLFCQAVLTTPTLQLRHI